MSRGQHTRCSADSGAKRPPLELADILRAHGEEFFATQPHLRRDQSTALYDIETCRTAARGGHQNVCPQCGFLDKPSYNSCGNRACPKCQSWAQADWVERREPRILPTEHFHIVFTLPHDLNPLVQQNQRALYGLLFRKAAETLEVISRDEKYLGAQIGFTAVLHTWTRDLRFHPHVHCIVSGGGLSLDGERWVRPKWGGKYLFPVRVLSALFKGKLMHGLSRLHRAGAIELEGKCQHLADPEEFAQFKDALYRKKWVVYAKRPFGGARHVYSYLGRYTHRVGISNQRLLSLDEKGVTFLTKNGSQATLPPQTFLRRFVQHVLPRGFTKIRHYGLFASANVNGKLVKARALLEQEDAADLSGESPLPEEAFFALLRVALLLVAILAALEAHRHRPVCPACGHKGMLRFLLARDPPGGFEA